MKIIKLEDPNLLSEFTSTILSGGLVIFPTDTTYGVGVDGTNIDAVSKLLKYKKRSEGKAISIAVCNQSKAEEFVEINSQAKNFYKNFLPGPVTIISKSKHNTDSRLESESGTLGIRIPNHKIMLNLLEAVNKPLTATSANISGGKTPYNVEDILQNLPQKHIEMIDLIIDAGELPKNPPSTVIDTTTAELTILRTGRIDPVKTKLINTKTSQSEEETIELGRNFVEKFYSKKEPLLVLLSGDLGAGKTHFTKGIAQKLGINNVIKSPTYNYVNEHKFDNNKLFHMDAWKIQSKEDLNSLGFYDWFKNGNVIVVEWPSVVMNLDEEFFKELKYFYLEFSFNPNNSRTIKIFHKDVE